MIKNIIAAMLGCALFVTVYAQNPAVDLLSKSSGLVDTLDNYSVEITTKVLAGALNGELIETTTGTIKKSGSNIYTQLGQVVAVQSGLKTIVIDKENNDILVAEVSLLKEKTDFFSLYKQLKPYIDTIAITSKNDEYTGISCVFKKAFGVYHEKIDMTIKNTTYLPERIIVYPISTLPMYEDEFKGRKMIMVIEYTNWSLNSTFNPTQFEISKFAIKRNGEWVPGKEFEGFDITTLN